MIRPDRLTLKAQEAFRDAGELARRRGNPVVNDAPPAGCAAGAAGGRGAAAAPEGGLQRDRAGRGGGARARPVPDARRAAREPSFSRELQRVFDRADADAAKLGDAYVSTEHLLLALARGEGDHLRGRC